MIVQELSDRKCVASVRRHLAAYSAQCLAAEQHVSGYKVAKPVVMHSANGFVMCAGPACRRLDFEKVAAVLGDPSMRLATEDELATIMPDYEVGAEPPLGAAYG